MKRPQLYTILCALTFILYGFTFIFAFADKLWMALSAFIFAFIMTIAWAVNAYYDEGKVHKV